MSTVQPGTTGQPGRAEQVGPAARPADPPVWLLVRALPFAALLLAWFGLSIGNRWSVNPDGVVYASLARRIAAGDFSSAVTGYWSPLLPGLAAPLVAVGVPALTALRLVLLAAALLALPVLHALCRASCGSSRIAVLATLLAVPLLASASVTSLHPELVLTVLLLLACLLILTGDGLARAVLAGVAGGLAGYAKPVAWPFVAGLVLAVLIARLVANRAARADQVNPPAALGRSAAAVLLVGAAVAAPWVIAISLHVGHPTLSTAGGFNARLVAPGAWGNPLSFPGLYPPVAPAITPWENPSLLPVPRTAAAAAEPVTVLDRAENVYRQGRVAVGVVLRRWTPVLLLAGAGLWLAVRRGGPGRRVTLGSALAAVSYAGGMSLLVVVERYLWFPMLISLPCAAVALQAVAAWWSSKPRRGKTFVPVGAAGALVASMLASAAPIALRQWGDDREVWTLANQLNRQAPVAGSLAGTKDWERSQLLAYLCGVDYLGLTGPDRSKTAQLRQLRAVDGAHLVAWGSSGGIVYDVTPAGLTRHAGQ